MSVVVELGNDPVTGKRRQLWRSLKGTKKEAQALLVQLPHDRDKGIDSPRGRLTVGAFLQRWLTDYARVHVAPQTYIQYEKLVGAI